MNGSETDGQTPSILTSISAYSYPVEPLVINGEIVNSKPGNAADSIII